MRLRVPITKEEWDALTPEQTCGVGGACTLCAWLRMGRGMRAKPRRRRPRFAIAWGWRVIERFK